MAVRVAINGFGRIGRLVARAMLMRDDFQLVAVNDLGDPQASAHLFKYDSVHGQYQGEVKAGEDFLIINGQKIKYLKEKDPLKLPWKELDIDVVIEATGKFKSRDKASWHLEAGANRVVITAPGKNPDATIVMGVNEDQFDPARHFIISNASCTTNCLAPVAKVILRNFGIVRGLMTTIHSFTNDQRVLDFAHTDLRRARSASMSMIPTSTGAATAVGMVIPELKGKLDGLAIRVPTPNVSVVDLTVELVKPADRDQLNRAFQEAAQTYLKGILRYTEEPLVSRDYNGESHSAVVDGPLTMALEDHLAKVIAWYDNEWGYSLRVVDLAALVSRK